MGRVFRCLAFGVIFSLLMGITGGSVPAAKAAAWQTKVDPWVLSTTPEGETEFLVFLSEQADLSGAAALMDKTAKGTYVYETLRSTAEISQKPIRASLDSLGIAYQPFWISNMLWVRGDINIVQAIAQRPDVRHIYGNPQVQLSLPEPDFTIDRLVPNATSTIEWNILKINADDVWAEGYTGQGVVIGGQDTGYDWDHPALINQYRGWNGATASHDFNWYDATGLSPTEPVDPHSHGTHTMGTMVGDDGGSNQIGVAPGAKWIGCRNMNNSGYGTPLTYATCYQWFVAPTRTDGSDPRPELAPDVINNSWSCPESEGCTEPDVLLTAVEAVRAAGILTAHSAGNSGPNCGTVDEPATIYAESFSVGSTTSTDDISSFSSRGPVTVDGSNRFKPQVTAPGSNIRSTIPGGGYGIKYGTSMAAPHVAGLTALLISAQPGLAGQVDELETLIEGSAVPLYTTETCGGDTPTSHPNHTYGWGRIDALAAYQDVPPGLLVTKTALDSIVPGNNLTYTLTVTNSHPFSDTHNVILTDTIPDKTAFFSATGNYSVVGKIVTWDLGDLSAKDFRQVELAVHVPSASTGIITNALYGAVSDEVTMGARNAAVNTVVHEPDVGWWIYENCLNQWLLPGDSLTCKHRLYNAGNYTDTYHLSEISINGEVTITPISITLGSEQHEPITVTITAPLGASGQEEITTTVTATSAADPSISEPLEIVSWVSYRQLLPIIFSKP